MRDQEPNFNEFPEEDVPASWQIATEGRPNAKALEEQEVEDMVCCVCHTGFSEDVNNLIFCDGCNMAVHQVTLSRVPLDLRRVACHLTKSLWNAHPLVPRRRLATVSL